MPVSQEFQDALSDLDAATNEVATVVDALRNQLKTSMTPEEVSNAKDTLSGVSARLRGIAKNPDDPVPPPPPEFQAALSRRR
jgi:hypothetical protein